jgi:hypothetical protein
MVNRWDGGLVGSGIDMNTETRQRDSGENDPNPLGHAPGGDVRAGIKNTKMLRETKIGGGRNEKE